MADESPNSEFITPDTHEKECVTLVGMAGAGKTTLGRLLAERLNYAHLDTDFVLESYYGMPLQALYDELGHHKFLEVEEYHVKSLGLRRTIISTGGSVIYGPGAVDRLRLLGSIVYLEIGLDTFLNRVGSAQGRGFALAPGMTMEAVYDERVPLYSSAADFKVNTEESGPEQCVEIIAHWVEEQE